ncbi:MAG: zinc-ribbon domain-containing protein [Acidobacteriota bacterium]
MFCPNCGVENRSEQNYCRTCGLKLDGVILAVSEQYPSKEYAALQRRKALFEKAGALSLSVAVLICVAFLLFEAAYYKLILFGPNVLFGSALGALIVSLLLSAFCFSYPKLFLKFEKNAPRMSPADDDTASPATNRLLADPPFEPVPSVTEHSTELLPNRDKVRR